MPSPTRPVAYPIWTQGNTPARQQPTNGEQFSGFPPNFRPPSGWHNWLFGIMSDWIAWLDYITQTSLIPNTYFDASVGTNGTFPDINTLMASGNISQIYNVLVTTAQTLTTTQVISESDIEFTFKPSAQYAQGASLAKGLSITVPRVTIRGGRFISWPGATAIQLETGAKNCLLDNIRFNTVGTPVNDLGQNNAQSNLIVEV
jgi:hypothetical protein